MILIPFFREEKAYPDFIPSHIIEADGLKIGIVATDGVRAVRIDSAQNIPLS